MVAAVLGSSLVAGCATSACPPPKSIAQLDHAASFASRGEWSKALELYRQAIAEYRQGAPAQPEPAFSDALQIADGLAALARAHQSAAKYLMQQRRELAAAISADPAHIGTRDLDVFWALCSQTGGEAEALAVVRLLVVQAPESRARQYLANALLPWIRAQHLYGDLYASRDLVVQGARLRFDLARFSEREATENLLTLYEAALVTGHSPEALEISTEILKLGDLRSSLIEIAERVRNREEADRLKRGSSPGAMPTDSPTRPSP